MKKIILLAAFLLLILPANTMAQNAPPKIGKTGNLKSEFSSSSDMPTDIKSDRMTYDAAAQKLIFESNVKVRRPDFDLDSKKLTVFFKKPVNVKPAAPKTGSANSTDPLSTMETGDIDRLVAEGNVHVVREKREGTCQKLTYFASKDLIVMEGNPILKEGDNSVSGRIINFYVAENRSEVIGDKASQVHVKFKSPSAKKKTP